ncbi:MAG TPA: hypothetical protein VM536_18770 [Chloroflexia bacterium]|nr:hypothetical protein [Chloroflexia bacterium]
MPGAAEPAALNHPPRAPFRLNLVTYNLCRGGNPGYGAWARLFDALHPDILLAQESAPPGKYLASRVRPWVPPPDSTALWAPAGRNTWGSAVFSAGHTLAPLPLPDDLAGWVVGGRVTDLPIPGSDGRPLHLYSVHTPRGTTGNYLAEVTRILDCIQVGAGGADLVIGGDFNIAISRRQAGETLKNTPGELLIFARLEAEFGLMNCWQTAHPGEPLARTLRFLHRANSPPYHCDGLFVPAAWRPALRCCEVLDTPFGDPPSDHNAVQAVFEWATPLG